MLMSWSHCTSPTPFPPTIYAPTAEVRQYSFSRSETAQAFVAFDSVNERYYQREVVSTTAPGAKAYSEYVVVGLSLFLSFLLSLSACFCVCVCVCVKMCGCHDHTSHPDTCLSVDIDVP